MNFNKADLVKYRFEKAIQCLAEAKTLAKFNHWDTVANRLYYACFYGVSAYLVKNEIQAITHKGIKSAFHAELIKKGVMSHELGRFYNDLFNKRQEADYRDFISFDEETIAPMIEETENFLQVIKTLV